MDSTGGKRRTQGKGWPLEREEAKHPKTIGPFSVKEES